MAALRALACPTELADLARAFVAEEATAVERHDVRGKLATIRNGTFFIRKKLEQFPEVFGSDPRLGQFLDLIEDELHGLGERLRCRLKSPQEVGARELELGPLACQLLDALPLPPSVAVHRPSLSGKVRADAAELQLALFCLVENAVEAMQGGAAQRLSVEIDGSAAGSWALCVEDTGPGLAALGSERVLEPFFTTHPGRLGLGLKIARRIARRWGGDLAVLPAAVGARIALRLPAAVSVPKAVLVVDDRETSRFALRALLESEGYQVDEAGSLAEARARLHCARLDLAIVDLHLGDGLGTELVDDLKALHPRAAVVMMSGSDEAAAAGTLQLTKATSPELVLRQIGQLLEEPRP